LYHEGNQFCLTVWKPCRVFNKNRDFKRGVPFILNQCGHFSKLPEKFFFEQTANYLGAKMEDATFVGFMFARTILSVAQDKSSVVTATGMTGARMLSIIWMVAFPCKTLANSFNLTIWKEWGSFKIDTMPTQRRKPLIIRF